MSTQVPTLAEIYQAKLDIQDINTFTRSSALTFVDSDSVTKKTLAGVINEITTKSGWFPVDGSFTAGGIVTGRNQILFNDADSSYYSWSGVIPPGGKVIPAASTPASTGGIAANAWVNRSTGALQTALADGSADIAGVSAALLGSRAQQWAVVTDPEFGADPTGAALSTAAFIAAQNASDFIVVPPGIYNMDVSSVVRIFSGKTWFIMGCEFIKAPGNARMFEAISEADFNLLGAATFKGNATVSDIQNNANFTGETALYIESCARYKVGDLNFRSMAGYGLKMSGAVGATPYFGERGRFASISASVCHFGMDIDAGNGSEYNTFVNYDLSANRVGLRMGAGNNTFAGGTITGNRYANVQLTGGNNNGHGSMVATTINHAGVYNLLAEDVTVGFTFAGCHWFGNAPNSISGQIFIRNSDGIVLDGGTLDCWVNVWKGALSGYHKMVNMWCPGGYGKVKVYDEIDLTPTNMLVSGCFGDGSRDAVTGSSINSKDCEVVLIRGPNGGQILTADTWTILQFPTIENVLTDNRRAWNAANSFFQVPVQMGGLYNISGRITLQTTGTIDIKNTRFRVLKNGTSLQLFRAYSKALASDDTDICSIDINLVTLLADGDLLQLEVNQAGTGTPVWSDPDSQMVITISKLQ